MTIRLNNRFSPNTHKKTDTLKKLKNQTYNKNFKLDIINKESENIPLLYIGPYTLLLGNLENGEFKEWVNKKHVSTPTANVLRPEIAITDFILKATNLFPNPETLLDRLIRRLLEIRKTNKT